MPNLLVEMPARGETGVIVRAKPAEASNECASNPCQNGGICIAANVHEGFKCDCTDYYYGASCQYKDRFCMNNRKSRLHTELLKTHVSESCVVGACIEAPDGGFQCVCPLDRAGERCENEISPKEKYESVYRFNGKTS